MAKKLFSLAELAQEAGLDEETLRRWVRSGALPASKLAGTTWRVDSDDWDLFVVKWKNNLTEDEKAAIAAIEPEMFMRARIEQNLLNSDNPAEREMARKAIG
jgi:excisionase family DNA binding protein